MEIVIIFTVQGQIMGERQESDELFEKDSIYKLKNPCLVVMNQTGAQLVPMASMIEGKTLEVNSDALLFKGTHKPVSPLLNKYNEVFGSGIQIVQKF